MGTDLKHVTLNGVRDTPDALSRPPPKCPTCKQPTTWRIQASAYVCYKCETQVPLNSKDTNHAHHN